MSLTAGTATIDVDPITGAVTASGTGMALTIATAMAAHIEATVACPQTDPLPSFLPPVAPPPIVLHIAASTKTSPIGLTAPGHSLTTGASVVVAGHLVNTAANGTFTIMVVDANHFTLDGSTGNGVGGATGTATFTPSVPPPPFGASYADWWASLMLTKGITLRTGAAPQLVPIANAVAVGVVASIVADAVVNPSALFTSTGVPIVGAGTVA